MKYRLVFSVLMSFVLSSLMSLWVTWINLGWSGELFGHWMNAFSLAWPAAAVIAFLCGPTVQAVTRKLVSPA